MNCFECAKANDVVPAVGLCRHCSVGLCLDHLIEASDYRLAGTMFGCPHGIPHVKSLRGVPAGIASAAPPPLRGCPVNTITDAPHVVGRDENLALLAKALGHPARVRILRLLLARDACYCGQLVDELPLAQATVSQHLKVLKEAGLVVGEIEGLRTCYWASRERLAELHALAGDLLAEAVGVDGNECD